MLAFGQPQPLPAHWDPPIRTTCTHAQCRTVQNRGPCPMFERSCPASTMDATIGQPSGHRVSGRLWPDGRTPGGHGHLHLAYHCRTGRDADRRPTNGTASIGTSSGAMTTRQPAGTPNPCYESGACGLALKDGSAMATLPARPQRPGSCSVSLRRPRRALAHCCPET